MEDIGTENMVLVKQHDFFFFQNPDMVHPKLQPIPIGICPFECLHLRSCVPAPSRYNEARPRGRQRRPGALGGSSQRRAGEGGGQGEAADDVCQHQPQEQGPWLGQDEVIWMKEKSFTELRVP